MPSITFLFVLTTLLSTLVVSADASPFASKPHARMARKRAGLIPPAATVPVLGFGQDPNQVAPTAPVSASNSASLSGTAPAGQPTNGGILGGAGSVIGSVANGLLPTASASVANATESQSSTSTTSQQQSSATNLPSFIPATPSPPIPAQVSDPAAVPGTGAITTLFSTAQAAVTSDPSSANSATSGIKTSTAIARTTIVIIAAVGGGIALIAIIWTVIRKTKFRPSNEFEDRLNPINWDPSSSTSGGDMIERERGSPVHHRSNSRGSNRSFHSADAQSTMGGNNSLISDLPNHDFTAVRPLGAYADMHRGPSPAPSVGGNSALMRGPSRGPSPYDYGSRGYGGGY